MKVYYTETALADSDEICAYVLSKTIQQPLPTLPLR
jgi:hypothetical protein